MSGEIPAEIFPEEPVDLLTSLKLYQNNFCGPIPETICNVSDHTIEIHSNNLCPSDLTSTWPECLLADDINKSVIK